MGNVENKWATFQDGAGDASPLPSSGSGPDWMNLLEHSLLYLVLHQIHHILVQK
jgi:hypothetical protein